MIKILVIDDERQIQRLLQVGLSGYGYDVLTVSNSAEALVFVARQKPDFILLDINLNSELDGLSLCSLIREWSATPIIMLTVNEDKRTKLSALNAGADDYVTKPFDMEELEARIRSVLRRSATAESNTLEGIIQVHDLVINLVKRQVTLGGEDIHLTPTEYRLLKVLATSAGKVLTFKSLIEELKGEGDRPQPEHYIRVYINTLRKKLHDNTGSTAKPHYIFNEPSIGYRFTDIEPTR